MRGAVACPVQVDAAKALQVIRCADVEERLIGGHGGQALARGQDPRKDFALQGARLAGRDMLEQALLNYVSAAVKPGGGRPHLSFFLSALLFWWALIHGRVGRLGYGASVFYVFTTGLHSGVLGALLTFARVPWYPAYTDSAKAWGLSALEDQQLAGLIMWVPAGVVYVVAGLALFASWLKESDWRLQRLSNDVSVITATNQVVKTIKAGDGPCGIAIPRPR